MDLLEEEEEGEAGRPTKMALGATAWKTSLSKEFLRG